MRKMRVLLFTSALFFMRMCTERPALKRVNPTLQKSRMLQLRDGKGEAVL